MSLSFVLFIVLRTFPQDYRFRNIDEESASLANELVFSKKHNFIRSAIELFVNYDINLGFPKNTHCLLETLYSTVNSLARNHICLFHNCISVF